MRKIICLHVVLAASLHLPIAAEIVSQDVAQDFPAPSIVTPVELPLESAPLPAAAPVPFPVSPSGAVVPATTFPYMTTPSVVAPPIQTVPALPVPAIPSQPANPPYIPFGNSTIPVAPGSSTYYTPYGPGPGLTPSPLESRLSGPLGQPFTPGTFNAPPVVLPVAVPGFTPGYRNEPLAPIPYLTRVPSPRHFGEPTYLAPGLVRFSNGLWAGSDYLYNLSQDIGVAVELVLPKELAGILHKERVRQEIEVIFTGHHITPFSLAVNDLPPLPFFHLIAFVVPVKESYVVNIAGRLFEEVKLIRLDYQLPGTVQAITWEKQELIVSSKSQVLERLMESAREIAIQFAGKIDSFNRLQFEHKEELKVQGAPVGTVVSPYLHEHSPCCTQ